MEFEGSFVCSQKLASAPYLVPNEFVVTSMFVLYGKRPSFTLT